jgi:archaellum component FlaC
MKENSSGGVKTAAQFAMSFAIVCLSVSIAYFTYEMARLGRHLPDVLTQVDQTTEKVNPIIGEVTEIRKLIPDILVQVEETRKMIPPILEEVEQTRKQIPPILAEVEQTRKQIPTVLYEVKAVRKEIPSILASTDKASAAVVTISKEVEATRPLISDAIKEVETTRESIPPMMDRADQMIERARVAGQQASEGAVTGVFTGIFTAPFTMVGDVLGMSKEEARRFSKKDIKMFNLTVNELLNVGSVGDKKEWNNPESGINGSVKILRFYVGEGDDEFEYADCSEVKINAFKEDEVLFDHQKSYCKDDDGKWNLIDND